MELKQSKSESNTRKNCEGKGVGYDMPPGVMVALFSNLVGRRKQRKPWEDWLKHVAKNNKKGR